MDECNAAREVKKAKVPILFIHGSADTFVPCSISFRKLTGGKNMVCRTIREILVQSEQKFGVEDAVRYKLKKDIIESKSYSQLRKDSESFSCPLEVLGEQGSHIAIIGMNSYEWIVTYFGTVNYSSVAVPLDVSLPADELCELIDRADVTTLVVDEIRKDVAAVAKQKCPKLKYVVSMEKAESDDEKRTSCGSFCCRRRFCIVMPL